MKKIVLIAASLLLTSNAAFATWGDELTNEQGQAQGQAQGQLQGQAQGQGQIAVGQGGNARANGGDADATGVGIGVGVGGQGGDGGHGGIGIGGTGIGEGGEGGDAFSGSSSVGINDNANINGNTNRNRNDNDAAAVSGSSSGAVAGSQSGANAQNAGNNTSVGGDSYYSKSRALALALPPATPGTGANAPCLTTTRGWTVAGSGASGNTKIDSQCYNDLRIQKMFENCLAVANVYAQLGDTGKAIDQMAGCRVLAVSSVRDIE